MASIPQIGEIRKTSNGCVVAKRVPRRDAGNRQHATNIAAIDFGTTNCSLAYIIGAKSTKDEPILLPLHGNICRVPTAILFDKNGRVKAFGQTARMLYRNQDKEDFLDCAFFEHIKMELQQDEVWCSLAAYIM